MSDAALVVKALRFLAEGWISGEDDRRWLVEVADMAERTPPREWWVCPLCAEVACDDGCPFESVRVLE